MEYDILNELNEKDVIELTPAWMATEYEALNQRLFDGKLMACDFGIFTTGRGSEGGTLGWFKITGAPLYVSKSFPRGKIYKKMPNGEKKWVTKENFVEICKPRIELNGNYRWTKKAAISTLVHEMCHYYCNMNGWRPTQHHGPEFNSIAFEVSRKSNDFFSVQRIAQAEQMSEMELNSVYAEKKTRRETAKKSRIIAMLIYRKNGEVRLINASNWNLVGDVERFEVTHGNCKKIMLSQDPDAIAYLFENGYRSTMRTYKFWDVTTKGPLLDKLNTFNWQTRWEEGVSEMVTPNISKMNISEIVRSSIDKLINEITANDAYTRFYSNKIPKQQYDLIMSGTTNMTPVHKLILDYIIENGWNEDVAKNLAALWTSGNEDATKYVLDLMPTTPQEKEDFGYWQIANIIERALKLQHHTEAGYVEAGYVILRDLPEWLITCTTSYAASRKYFGDTHWCTASDLGGNFNGWKMFLKYTGLDDDGSFDDDYGILVQAMNKRYRESDSYQMVIFSDGELGSMCDYSDHTIIETGKVLEHIGFQSAVDLVGGLDVIKRLEEETAKNVDDEYRYWSVRSYRTLVRRKEQFVSKSPQYEQAIKHVIEKSGDHVDYYETPWGKIGEGARFTMDEVGYANGARNRVFNVALRGFDDNENEWISYAYDEDNWEILNGFNNEMWITTPDGKQIIKKVPGYFAESIVSNVIEAARGDFVGDSDPSNYCLISSLNGNILVKNFEAVRDLDTCKFLEQTTEDGHKIIIFMEWHGDKWYPAGIDAETCKYLGHIDIGTTNVFGCNAMLKA